MVDDSIVRGTTSKTRVKSLRQAGAKEVHLRISCPPHKFPCAYGIDFPTREELIANKYSHEEIRKYFECDSIGYLSLEGMLKCASFSKDSYCTACWSGKYPVKLRHRQISYGKMPMSQKPRTVTYKKSGVDVDKADQFVESIKPYARATRRPEVLAGIGGFGALCKLPDKNYKDRDLVSSTDGVGISLKSLRPPAALKAWGSILWR